MTTSQEGHLYHHILGLPNSAVTAPDAYELLGLQRFESDPKTIKTAAMDRNALLQVMQNAENYEDVKRLEREVGEAMVCLTNPERKSEYDRNLRETDATLTDPIPPNPPVASTETLRKPEEETVEVKILPDDPPGDAILETMLDSPVPKSGIRMLPPPTSVRKNTEKPLKNEPRDSQMFLPGEIPWQLRESGWRSRPGLAKSIGIGASHLLLLILVVSFWPSSTPSSSETTVEDDASPAPIAQQETPEDSKRIGPDTIRRLSSEVLFQDESKGLEDFAMAPNGRWVVTLGRDGLIRYWEESTPSPQVLNASLDGGIGSATHLAAMPDGSRLFAATLAGELQEYSLAEGVSGRPSPTIHTSENFEPGICALEVTSDGQRVVGMNANSELLIFGQDRSLTSSRSFTQEPYRPLTVLPALSLADTIVVPCSDRSLRVWNPSEPFAELEPLISRTTSDPDLPLAYNANGTRLATTGPDHQIHMIDLTNLLAKRLTCIGHTGRIHAMVFSNDGNLIVSAGADRSVRVWDASTGAELAVLGGHAERIAAVALTNDDQFLLTVSFDGLVRKWSVGATESPPPPILPPPSVSDSDSSEFITERSINRLDIAHRLQLRNDPSGTIDRGGRLAWMSVSPDGRQIAAINSQAFVTLYDGETGRLRRVLPFQVASNGPVRFSADGQTLIALQSDGFVSSWDVESGRLLDRIPYSPVNSLVPEFAVATNSSRFALPTSQNVVEIYTQSTELGKVAATVTLSQPSHLVVLRADGRMLAIDLGSTLEIWDLGDPATIPSPQLQCRVPFTGSVGPRAIALSPKNDLCAVGTDQGRIEVFSALNAKPLASFTGHPNTAIRGLAFDVDGTLLFTAGEENRIHVWNTKNWNPVATISPSVDSSTVTPPRGRRGRIPTEENTVPEVLLGFQLLANGKVLALSEESGSVVAWKVGRQENANLAARHIPTDFVVNATDQPLSEQPAVPINPSPSSNGQIDRISKSNIGKIAQITTVLGHNSVQSVAFGTDSRVFVSGGSDNLAHIWDATTIPPQKLHTLKGHAHKILAVASSGDKVATADSQGYIKLWDRTTGAELFADTKKAHHSGGVQDLAFCPDGQHLASVGQDKMVKVWLAASMTEATNLKAEHKSTVLGLTWVSPNEILSCDAGNRIIHWQNVFRTNPLGLGFQNFRTTTTMKPNTKIITGFAARINAIASAPGNKAAFASENGDVGFWNGQDEIHYRLEEHKKPVKCVAFTPDGSILVSAGGDDFLLFWTTEQEGALLHTLPVPLVPGTQSTQIQAIEISPDGRRLLTGDAGGELKLWGVPNPP